MTVRVRDRGARLLLERAATIRRQRVVDVGVLGSDASATHDTGEGVTVGEIAAFHEFGLGVPRRSWLRDTVDQNIQETARLMSHVTEKVAKGQLTQDQALGQIGAFMQGKIQQRMAQGIPPALAESTIARKGSSTPLIDTGQLRSSVAHQVRDANEGG